MNASSPFASNRLQPTLYRLAKGAEPSIKGKQSPMRTTHTYLVNSASRSGPLGKEGEGRMGHVPAHTLLYCSKDPACSSSESLASGPCGMTRSKRISDQCSPFAVQPDRESCLPRLCLLGRPPLAREQSSLFPSILWPPLEAVGCFDPICMDRNIQEQSLVAARRSCHLPLDPVDSRDTRKEGRHSAREQRLTTTAATWHMKPKSEKRISPAAAMMQPDAVRATIASRNVLYSARISNWSL